MNDVRTTAQQWQRVKSILADALEQPSPEERTAYLECSCGGDTTLMREVEALLAQSTRNLDQLADNTPVAFTRQAPAQPTGRRIGAYEIAREIGRGGMGAVYLAKRADGQFDKEVAIKLLKRGTDTDEILRRFQAERRILARLDHPNIARLLDAGTTDDGLPYFVMEYVDGVPITSFVRDGQLSVAQRLQLFLKVCEAVQFAHQQRVVHRDLKPGNIFVRQDGEPKLLDFGIAKLLASENDAIDLTLTAERRFTLVCASPEQARGETVTPASDVYALGALLYELLTGISPHRFVTPHPTADEIARVICELEAVRPSLAVDGPERRRELRGDLDTIALTALRKEPSRRYRSVAELAEDVRRHAAGKPIVARKNTASYVATRFLHRNYRRIAAALLLAGIGLLLGFLLFRSASQPRMETQQIRAEDDPEQATHDAGARRLFLQARTLVYEFGTGAKYQESLTNAVQLLENAVARDPKFSLACSLLAEAHLYLYRDFEHTDAHLHAGKEAADAAQRLAPESGAAHFAQAVYFYDGERDLPHAENEITAALRALPTRADALEVATKVESRLGKWKEAIEHGEKAVELDPRDPALIPALVQCYTALRRYGDADRVIDRALGVLPPQFAGPLWRRKAGIALAQGNVEAARAALQSSPVNTPMEDYLRLQIAILARDFDGARAIANKINVPAMEPWPLFWRGVIARATGDDAYARETFAAAATKLESKLRDRPNDPDLLSYLALSEAGAGEKDKALQQARHALEICPVAKDAIDGAKVAVMDAEVYAWLGQSDVAITKLAMLVKIPAGPDYGRLALDPAWDSLRNDPRFGQLLEQARRPIDLVPNGKEGAAGPTVSIQEKSIAVLPFENLGDDKANAFFADGMQDEILNDLAKVADLKVVSRRSVMQYRGTTRNLKEIGEVLQVAYVLEGAVQKIGSRIHMSAHLVDTRTGRRVWAENYDRDVADVFAMQVELAEKIVVQLKVSFSPREKVAIAERTTNNVEAYDWYLRAKSWAEQYRVGKEGELEAEGFLEKAIERDPNFARAYCLLSEVELTLYRWFEHSPARQAKAENAVKAAIRLRPDMAEVRLAEAGYYYRIRDFEKARSALAVASRMLPNNSDVLVWTAAIDKRQGRWKESLKGLERALELDPRNPDVLHDLINTYRELRRYSDSERLVEGGLAAFPEAKLAFLDDKFSIVYALGDTKTCREIIESLPRGYNPGGHTSYIRFHVAFLDRDWEEAERIIDAAKKLAPEGYVVPIPFLYGFMARAQGEQEKARTFFTQARKVLEQTLIKRPDDAEPLIWMGLTDAALGRKEEALREGREAVAKEPISRDASTGVDFETSLAQIYAWAGEKDLALEQLATVARLPNGPTVGSLKLSADWDDVRGDPRFAQILEESARPIDLVSMEDKRAMEPVIPEKSIAVLPFDNLSDDSGHAYFTVGIQEDIQASLAKVADLKVTSHASTALYRGPNKNIREIGRSLRVAHVLEGSVQKTQGHVRVYARLTDTRTGRQLWAEQYDRALDDLFAIQNEITRSIVEQMKAALSPQEQALMREKPTKDMVAYDLYLQAREIERNSFNGMGETTREIVLLDEATRRDPAFVAALCLLTRAHLDLYWLNLDHTAIRLELARKALDTAAQAKPDAGEVHLARAILHYWGSRDYRRALEELAIARGQLPNDPEVLQFTVGIEKREGHWEEARRVCEQAIALDPLNPSNFRDFARSIYVSMRLYAEAGKLLDTVLNWKPNDFGLQRERARIDVASKADLSRLQSVVSGESARTADPNLVAAARLELALRRRDYPAAERALADYRLEDFNAGGFITPRQWYEGVVARSREDREAAQNAFTLAHERVAAAVRHRPEDAKALIILAEIDAALGHKQDAIKGGLRAMELLPVSKDAADGPTILGAMASVYAQLGETKAALDLLESCAAMPNGPDYGSLKLDQEWDPLRSNPRFDKILALLAPKI